jgi:hypothetical protein
MKKIVRFFGLVIPLSASLFVLYYMVRFFINPQYRVIIYESSRLISGLEILVLLFGVVYLSYLIWNLV